MNRVTLVGRLCKEPELKYTKNGKPMVEFSIAVPRKYKNQNGEYETDFINLIGYNALAENTASFCKKADIISVEGSLRHDIYETQDGKRYKDYVLAEEIGFISTGKNGE